MQSIPPVRECKLFWVEGGDTCVRLSTALSPRCALEAGSSPTRPAPKSPSCRPCSIASFLTVRRTARPTISHRSAPACGTEASAGGTEESQRTPTNDVAWGPTPFGTEAAPVDGDLASGPHVTLIRFGDGLVTAVHTQTSDYVGIVISGTTRHLVPGARATPELSCPPVRTWFLPGGLPHVSECISGASFVMELVQKSAFDFHPTKEGGRP